MDKRNQYIFKQLKRLLKFIIIYNNLSNNFLAQNGALFFKEKNVCF